MFPHNVAEESKSVELTGRRGSTVDSCLIIWNPGAGSAREAAELRKRLESRTNVKLRETSSGEEARWLASTAMQEGFDRVIAAGGDGTINAVVNGLYASEQRAVLGILPLGTGNDLCRSLGISLDPFQAADLILNNDSPPRAIDLIRAESAEGVLVFANVCSGGNSQRVGESLTDEVKQSWGAWSYLRGAIQVLTDLTGFDVEVKYDDGPFTSFDLWNVVVANGTAVAGGVIVAPEADASDGLLDVILIQNGDVLDIATLSAKVLLGNYLEDDRVIFRRARRVEFRSKPEMPFVADGETVGTAPVVFTVEPASLRVLAGKVEPR